MTLLQWLIPSGALGTVVLWLTNRTIRQARVAKEVHDTYKVMYEDVQKTLLELQQEYDRLYKEFNLLKRILSKANACKHWDRCPLKLYYSKEHTAKTRGQREYEDKREAISATFGCSRVEGEAGDTDCKPP